MSENSFFTKAGQIYKLVRLILVGKDMKDMYTKKREGPLKHQSERRIVDRSRGQLTLGR